MITDDMNNQNRLRTLPELIEDRNSIRRHMQEISHDSVIAVKATLEASASAIESNTVAFKEYMRSIYEEQQKADSTFRYDRENVTSAAYDTISEHIAKTLQEASNSSVFERADKLKIMKYLEKSIKNAELNEHEKKQLLEQYQYARDSLKNTSTILNRAGVLFVRSIGNITGILGSMFSDLPPIFGWMATRGGDLVSKFIERRRTRKERALALNEDIRNAENSRSFSSGILPRPSLYDNADPQERRIQRAVDSNMSDLFVTGNQQEQQSQRIEPVSGVQNQSQPQVINNTTVVQQEPKEDTKSEHSEAMTRPADLLATERASKIDRIKSETGSLLEGEPTGSKRDPFFVVVTNAEQKKKEKQQTLFGKALSGMASGLGLKNLFGRKTEANTSPGVLDGMKTLFRKRRGLSGEGCCCCESAGSLPTTERKKSRREQRRERRRQSLFERNRSAASNVPDLVSSEGRPQSGGSTSSNQERNTTRQQSRQVSQQEPRNPQQAAPDIRTQNPERARTAEPQRQASGNSSFTRTTGQTSPLGSAVGASSEALRRSGGSSGDGGTISKIATTIGSVGSKALPYVGTALKIGARALPIAAAGMLAFDAVNAGAAVIDKYNSTQQQLDGKLGETITDGSLFKAIGKNFSLGTLFSEGPMAIVDKAIQEVAEERKTKQISEAKPENSPNIIEAVNQSRGTLSEQLLSAEQSRKEQETIRKERDLAISHSSNMVQNVSTINNVNNNTQQVIRMTNPEAANVNGSSR